MRERKLRQTAPLLRNKKGTTMVEVLVAVMIVMIVMVMFGKVVSASVSLYQKAAHAISQTEKFDEEYYKKASIAEREDVKGEDESSPVTFVLTEKNSVERTNPTKIALPKGKIKKFTDTGTDRTGLTRYMIDIVSDEDTP